MEEIDIHLLNVFLKKNVTHIYDEKWITFNSWSPSHPV